MLRRFLILLENLDLLWNLDGNDDNDLFVIDDVLVILPPDR